MAKAGQGNWARGGWGGDSCNRVGRREGQGRGGLVPALQYVGPCFVLEGCAVIFKGCKHKSVAMACPMLHSRHVHGYVHAAR